jgi:STE24 endopeptidase
LGGVYLGIKSDEEIKITLVFLLLQALIDTIKSLPFELYKTFKIEKKHGFNKQTYRLFFSDKMKSFALSCVIGGPFIALMLKIMKIGGDSFYIYLWVFTFCFSIFMMTIVPVVIMPMFNTYEPLEDGILKTRIYDLAGKLNYPLKNLFVMDGSKRSSHSNAFMFGFGSNKRIVLFDTLIEQVSNNEILAIFGHELGHWKLGHTLTNFAVTQVYFGVAFYFFSQCFASKDLYAAFGFDSNTSEVPTIIALLLFFQTLWAPVDKVLSFVLTVFSRHCEFAADKFSVDLDMSQDLQSGLCKIHLENLGAMCPDFLYSMYHYSHPPLVERLSAMMALDEGSRLETKKGN